MDTIFKALNDPTRRKLLDRLRQKDGQTLTELETSLEMSRFGVMKHLGVLEEANLINTRKVGRFKHHYLNALPLQEVIDRWIEPLLAKPKATGVLALKAELEVTAQMSDTKPDFVMSTFIHCTQDALWDALTEPSHLERYEFLAGKVVRDGNTLTYYLPDRSELLICTETHREPKTKISSTFEPRWEENAQASRYDYLASVEGPACKLTIEHFDLPSNVQNGVAEGWARTISSLKTYLEAGSSPRFPMLKERMG